MKLLKSLFVIFCFLISTIAMALEFDIDSDDVTPSQLKNFNKHIQKLVQILPKSFNRIDEINIRFEQFDKSKGSLHLGDYNSFLNRITINSAIIPQEGHSEELLRVLIHEITHAFEDQVTTIHDDLKFWYLSGWHKRGAVFYTRGRRNFMESRSPDPYEFSHPRETLAVNMEYFLTDPIYQCRRPLLFDYLVQKTGHSIPWIDCPISPEVPLAINNDLLWTQLYSKNLYEVHYLMASEGDAVMSRFGHSMLRLVFCAPEREVVGKECLRDLEHHIVVSYRANVTDLILSYWGGMVGKYPSQMYLMTLSQVIQEYNEVELRDLISVPIKLSFQEKERLIPLILSEVWSYRGKYRFVTQNCATETMDFLKKLINNERLLKKKVTTPKGVLRKLKKLKLVDDSVVYGKNAKKFGYFFENKSKRYRKIFKKVQKYFSQFEDMSDYLEDSEVEQRTQEFDKMIQEGVSKSVAASMYVLEKQIQRMKSKKFFDKATRRILLGSGVPDELREYVKRRVLPQDISGIEEELGYGIPMPSEFGRVQTILNNPKDTRIAELMTTWLEEHLSDDLKELKKIKVNLENYQSYLTAQ